MHVFHVHSATSKKAGVSKNPQGYTLVYMCVAHFLHRNFQDQRSHLRVTYWKVLQSCLPPVSPKCTTDRTWIRGTNSTCLKLLWVEFRRAKLEAGRRLAT